METGRVLQTLRDHEAELKAAGIVHLHLFGAPQGPALVKGTAAVNVDLMADFDPTKPFSVMSVGNLERRLTHLLGMRVDLAASAWMRQPVREQALRDAFVAF
jgi:uncharacterized protein